MPDLLSTGISVHGVIAVVVVTILHALAFLLSITRFILRRQHGFAADDFCLMVALCGLLAMLVGQYLVAFRGGEGYSDEQTAQHPETVENVLLIQYWLESVYTLTIVLIKTSILLSYYRIFGHLKHVRNSIFVLLGLSWAWGISTLLVALFQCNPIDKTWHKQKPGHCIDFLAYEWGKSISNLCLDWMILIVPIRPVLKLQMPLSQKTLVFSAFMCGSLACIASTVRAIMLSKYDPAHLGEAIYQGGIWVWIEPAMGVISCCLPLLGRVFQRRIQQLSDWLGSQKNSDSSNSSKPRRAPLIPPEFPIDQQAAVPVGDQDYHVHPMQVAPLNPLDGEHRFQEESSYQMSFMDLTVDLNQNESTRSLVDQGRTFYIVR